MLIAKAEHYNEKITFGWLIFNTQQSNPNLRHFIRAALGRIGEVLTALSRAGNRASEENRASGTLKTDCIHLTRPRTPPVAEISSRDHHGRSPNPRPEKKRLCSPQISLISAILAFDYALPWSIHTDYAIYYLITPPSTC